MTINYVTEFESGLKSLLNFGEATSFKAVYLLIPTATIFEIVKYKFYFKPVRFAGTGYGLTLNLLNEPSEYYFKIDTADSGGVCYLNKDGDYFGSVLEYIDWLINYSFKMVFTLGETVYERIYPLSQKDARIPKYQGDDTDIELFNKLFQYKDNPKNIPSDWSIRITVAPTK